MLAEIVGGAAAGIGSGLLGIAGAAQEQKYTQENMKLANKMNKQNVLESAALNKAGLKAAGMNPALAEGGNFQVGAATSQVGARPDLSGVVGATSQGAMLGSTLELQDSQAAKNREEAEAQKLKNDEEKSRREAFTLEYVHQMQKMADNPKASEEQRQFAAMVVKSSKEPDAPLYNKGLLQGLQDFKDYDRLAAEADTGVLENKVKGAIAQLELTNGHTQAVAGMSQAELTKVLTSTVLFMADASLKAQQEAESYTRTQLVLPAEANHLAALAQKARQDCIKEYHQDPWAMWDNGEKGKAFATKTEDFISLAADIAGLVLGFKSAAALKTASAAKSAAEDARQQKSFNHDKELAQMQRAYQTKRENKRMEHEKELTRMRNNRKRMRNFFNGQGRLTGSVEESEE